jgi:acetylornithine aminotransferase
MIKPDVMTLAKALGNGMPIGACLARGAAADAFGPGNHGTTFGGNPLACAVGLSVIDAMEKDKIIDNSAKMGQYLLSQLKTALASTNGVVDIRGRGMIIGIELDRSCATLVARGLKEGVIINVTADKVVRLVPPLIFSKENCDLLIKQLTTLLQQFLQETQP